MSNLLDALLNIAKLDAGTIEPEISHFPIQGVLDALQADNLPNAEQKDLSFEIAPSEEFVYSDPVLLQRILENFVTNAIRYTEQGGIQVRAQRIDGDLEIDVADTGIGIPESSINDIFSEFVQLDNHARERRKGLGLGLSIVKMISDLLNAPVKVRSRVNQGSVFTVTVPIGAPQSFSVEEEGGDVTPKMTQTQPLIFLVEDDPEVRAAMTLMLELAGMRTTEASDGQVAINMLSNGLQPDMIVTDYRLPGADGLEVIRQAKAMSQHDLPSVIITGDTSGAETAEADLTRCTVLTKPIDTTRLIELIEEAIAPS